MILDFVKGLFIKKKVLDVTKLPSQGFFYKKNFKISIKKVSKVEILEYEYEYDREDISLVLGRLKKIVENNTIISKGYSFNDIKSIDVIFIFLEIVRFTKNRPVQIEYFKEDGFIDKINFDEESFNYCNLSDDIMINLNKYESCFDIDGYRFTLPSIGVEKCLTNFLIKKSYIENSFKYNEYNYNFTYFLGDKNYLGSDEIENLIQIFNTDMDDEEIKKTDNIVKIFIPIQKYSLIKNGKVIEMSSKINLQEIWK